MGHFLYLGLFMRLFFSLCVFLSLCVSSPAFAKAEYYTGITSDYSIQAPRPHYNVDRGGKGYVWFDQPQGGAVWNGELYFADKGNHRIRQVRDDGFDEFNQIKSWTETVVGSGNPTQGTAAGFSGDGGNPRLAKLNSPTAVTFDDTGAMYIADDGNHRIRKVSKGTITTIAGNGSGTVPVADAEDIWNGYGYPALESPVVDVRSLVWSKGELYIGSEWGLFYISTEGIYYQITRGIVRGLAVDREGRIYANLADDTRGDGLFRVLPNKSLISVHSVGNEFDAQIGNFDEAEITLGAIDFDSFGALLAVGDSVHFRNVFKIFGNTIRKDFGWQSEKNTAYSFYPRSIAFDHKNNRYFVINSLHESVYVVSNTNDGEMPPMDGGDDVDGSCGLDATTDGEVFSCNPVNLATGTKVDYALDLGHSSPYPIQWGRYYHSQKGGWTFEYERSLKVSGGSSRSFMQMHRPDGVTLNFKRFATGPWEQNMDKNKTVVNVPITIKVADVVVGYEYKNLKDETERYNANGQLQYIQSKEGWRLTMQYDGMGRLIKVTDSFNHFLTLSYVSPTPDVSFLNSVTDGERTIMYTHIRGKKTNLLTKVTHPDGNYIEYRYDTSPNSNIVYVPGRGLLTEIIAEDFKPFARYTYNSMGQALSTEHYAPTAVNRNEFNYYPEEGVVDFVQNGMFNTAFVGKKWYTNGASKPRNILSPCLTCIGSKFRRSNYDERGNPVSQFDFNNVQTNNVYDTTRNLLISQTKAVGKPGETMMVVEWHPQWRLPTKVVEEKLINDQIVELTTISVYNGQGQVLSTTVKTDGAELPRSTSVVYNSQGLPHVLTDAMGRQTTLTYDQFGNVTSQTNNLGQVITFGNYTVSGIPRLTTYPNGLQRKTTLDANQRVTSIKEGTENSTWREINFEYDVRGRLIKKYEGSSFASGRFETYGYDWANRLISLQDGFGEKTYIYDEYSRVVKETTRANKGLSEAQVKEYSYDEFGRIQSEKLNANWQRLYTHDLEGNLINVVAPDMSQEFEYDEFNQLVREKSEQGYGVPTLAPPSSTTTRSYYSDGLLKSATDERGVVTSYKYNGFGELIESTSPDKGKETFERNKNGEVVKMVDARGVTSVLVRDGLGRIVQKNMSSAPTPGLMSVGQNQTFTYDTCPNGVGRLCSVQNYASQQNYAYNFWGEVVEKTIAPSGTSLVFTVKYQYNQNGVLKSTEYPTGRYTSIFQTSSIPQNITVDYIRMAEGDPTEYWYWEYVRSSSSPMPFSQEPQSISTPLGETVNEYDGFGALRKSTTPTSPYLAPVPGVPSLTTLPRTFVYDFSRNTVSFGTVTNLNFVYSGEYKHHYKGYLTSSRLVTTFAPPKSVGSTSILDYRFAYDIGGNRIQQKMEGVSESEVNYTYSSTSNRLMSISQYSAPPQTFTYDNAGNTITGDGWSYTYDEENRLRRAEKNNIVNFEYNALGQRIKKDGPNGVEYFVHDEQGRVLGVYDQLGQAKDEFVWAEGWTPAAVIKGPRQKSQYYAIETDHLAAPLYVKDRNGKTVWSWDHREAFGYMAPNEDIDGDGVYFELNLRFPGQWFDKETGLFHNGFRDYNPSTGRYMQSDPLGLEAGFNTYAYVGSNPLRAVDPYGLVSEFIPYSEKNPRPGNYADNSLTFKRHIKAGTASYRLGYITTSKGRRVEVALLESGPKLASQNCHGYALGLNYWIQDPTEIYEDDYEEVEYSKATHTLFRRRISGVPVHSGLNHRYNGPYDLSFGKWGVTPTKVSIQSNLEILNKPTYYRKRGE